MSSSNEVVLYNPAMFPTLLDQDPREVEARFLARFEKAKSLDDLFDVMEGNNASGLVGETVEITAVAWAPYLSDDGIIPNAICQAINLTDGEVIEFATTSKMCTHFIRQAEVIGAIPFRARIAQVTTRSGQKALNLERVPQGDKPARKPLGEHFGEEAPY